MDDVQDRFNDLNYHWSIYAKNYGYSEQSRSVLYATFKAGWLAAKSEDKRIVKAVKNGDYWTTTKREEETQKREETQKSIPRDPPEEHQGQRQVSRHALHGGHAQGKQGQNV